MAEYCFVFWSGISDPTSDPSVIYRCLNFQWRLARLGHVALVIHQKDFENDPPDLGEDANYIFFRPVLTDRLVQIVLERGLLQRSVVDFDDLIFDASRFEEIRFASAGHGEKRYGLLADWGEALQFFPKVSVSTPRLGQAARDLFGVDFYVKRNFLNHVFHASAERFFYGGPSAVSDSTVVLYTGTKSHVEDLARISDSIASFLEGSRSRVLLCLDRLAEQVFPEHRQVVSFASVPFNELPRLYGSASIAIAPVGNSNFARSKSSVKLLEAGAFGLPVVADQFSEYEETLYECLYSVDGSGWMDSLVMAEEQSKTLSWLDRKALAASFREKFHATSPLLLDGHSAGGADD